MFLITKIKIRKICLLALFTAFGLASFLILAPNPAKAAKGDIFRTIGPTAEPRFTDYPAAAGVPIALCADALWVGFVLDSNGDVWQYSTKAPGDNYFLNKTNANPFPGTGTPVDIHCRLGSQTPRVVSSTGDLYKLNVNPFGIPLGSCQNNCPWSGKLNTNNISNVIAMNGSFALTSSGDVYKFKVEDFFSDVGSWNLVTPSGSFPAKPVDIGADQYPGFFEVPFLVLASNGDVYSYREASGGWYVINSGASFPSVPGGGKPMRIDGTRVLDTLSNVYHYNWFSYELVGTHPEPLADLDKFLFTDPGTHISGDIYMFVEKGPDFMIYISPESNTVNQGASVNYNVLLISVGGFSGAVNLSYIDLSASNITLTFLDPSGTSSCGNPGTYTPVSSVTLAAGGSKLVNLCADTTAFFTPVSTYTVTATGTAVIDGNTVIHSDSAGLIVTIFPWIKTTGGNVGSLGAIGPIQRDLTLINEFNADYLVISRGAIDPNFRSVKNWLVGSDTSLKIYPEPSPTMYDTLWNRFGKDATKRTTDDDIDFPNPGGVFWYDGNFTLNGCHSGGSFKFSGNAVFFVHGNLTLKKDIGDPGAGARCNYNDGNRIVFVVSGSIVVDKDPVGNPVRILNGYFIANGNFSDGSSNQQLIINGGLAAFGNISLQRTFSNGPAELINFDPAYLWYFRDLIGEAKIIFRELAP